MLPGAMRAGRACAGVALAAAAVVAAAAPAPAKPHAPAALPSAHVWITTPDGTMRMSDRGTVPFRRGGSDRLTITVDPSRAYQRMDGFGASITDSSAVVLSRLSRPVLDATMTGLFSPTEGDGLSFLRQPMGSSDFTAGPHYTYDDVPAGETDYRLRRFSVAHDRAQILPLLRRALRLNPRLKVIGTPWSPPAWMKTSQSLIGGRLIDDPRIYDAYARYFVKFVEAYQRAGVPIYGLTLQNEPQNRNPNAYPGMDLPVAQEAKLVEALAPRLRAAGLHTKLFGYDHNWSEHPNDIASTPPGQDPETEYPFDLMRSPAGKDLAGTAFHCYSGDPSRQTEMHDAFPHKGIWFTECSGSHGPSDPPAQVFSDTLKWHARNVDLGVTRNWGKTVVNWNLALDPSGGPHNGGCDTCTGVVTVGPGDQVTRNAEYYTLGHLARFVRPGASRIASTSFGTTGWNGQIMDAAFRNPDGSTALVVHNENDDPRSFAVQQGGASFEYTLPGGALATFTWPRSHALASGLRLLDFHGMTAGASANAADAGNAVDDDATTRWTSGAAQQPGQSLTVDLGREQTVRRVVLDTGADQGDFPRGYTLATSRDGSGWHEVARGTGSGQLTSIDVRRARARFLRVTQTGSAPQWWSIADLRVYR
jgi:glucosylceramidase